MAAPSFPAPPDLSELLRYFASTYDTSAGSQKLQQDRHKAKQSQEASVKQHLQHHQREPSSRDAAPRQREPGDWNGSTQIPAAGVKPLKHQILDRTFQPPAPVLVDVSGTTHLLQRLSKTTVSSRLKRHQADETAALAAATAVLTNASERRSQRHLLTKAPASAREQCFEADGTIGESVSPPCVPPDARARDGIQTLLMYRREVGKRLDGDPTHFPSR
ncbi:hypothetical protein PybrP1_010921 [[Pythium] brassicae (nom. inval.)]|nr:hypothetical protein PybrP1_010921 [[Pythium] brassicae (nom. inval.)]